MKEWANPLCGGALGSASADAEAVRRIRTSPNAAQSPPSAADAPSVCPPGGVVATAKALVPGGLGVLGRAHALHAHNAGCGHLGHVDVLSPRVAGGVSVRLGGKSSKGGPPPVMTVSSVQRI